MKGNSTSLPTEAEKTQILQNLAIAQDTIRGGVIKSEVVESDRAEYQFRYTLSVADISNKSKTYTVYYNVVKQDETSERIEGIAILDEVEYAVVGEKETEEDEQEFKFKIALDESNYVVIEQEVSVEEQEFKYQSFQNGKMVYETQVEYETEEDGEVELKFNTITSEGESTYKYEFFSDKDGSFVEVKTETSGSQVKALIKIITNEDGTVTYEFVTDSQDND